MSYISALRAFTLTRGRRRGLTARRVFHLVSIAIIVMVCVISLLPLYWMIVGSFKLQTDNIKIPPEFWPSMPTLANYNRLFFGRRPVLRWLLNSSIVASGATFLAVLTSTMAGYALGKKRFMGAQIVLWTVIATMMIPGHVYLIPRFLIMKWLGWFDTYQGMIAPWVAYPFGIFLMKQFMQSIPDDLIDAARIDGASELGVFWHIILPLSKPVVGALAIFVFNESWRDYVWQLVMVTKEEMLTLLVGVSQLATGWMITDLGLLMAGATFAFIPMLAIFIFFQDYFVKGISAGALKG